MTLTRDCTTIQPSFDNRPATKTLNYIYNIPGFLTIVQREVLDIFVVLQFSGRTFGDTQGNGLDLPVDEVKVARIQKENKPKQNKKINIQ